MIWSYFQIFRLIELSQIEEKKLFKTWVVIYFISMYFWKNERNVLINKKKKGTTENYLPHKRNICHNLVI